MPPGNTGGGVLADVRVADPAVCQIAPATRDGARATAVSRSGGTGDDGRLVEEFTTDRAAAPAWAEEVFGYDGRAVYRFTRERDQGCLCERIEDHGCPVREVVVEDGHVDVSFVAAGVGTVRDVVADLRTDNDGVSVRRLTRGEAADGERRVVFVDRSVLTDRQREVLRTAHEMGYFAHPKGANAGEVADALGIGASTFAEHLAAAQSKMMAALLDE